MTERVPIPGARPPRSCEVFSAAELGSEQAAGLLCFARTPSNAQESGRAAVVVDQLGLELDSIRVAFDRDGTIGAAALVYNPGGAVAFGSPITRDGQVGLVAAALDCSCRSGDPLRANVAEGIASDSEVRMSRALVLGGFDQECRLLDLAAALAAPLSDSPRELPHQINLIAASLAPPSWVARGLEASFRNSPDYDDVAAKRTTQEHIALMRWRRHYDPDLWFCVVHDDSPVGLCALFIDGDSLELSYLGLSPEWRGRGLGGAIMQRVIWMGAELGLGQIQCVVKEKNAGAVAFYQRHGFAVVSSRTLFSRLEFGYSRLEFGA